MGESLSDRHAGDQHVEDEHADDHLDSDAASEDPATYWEKRYADVDRVWSGRVNALLAQIAGEIAREMSKAEVRTLGFSSDPDAGVEPLPRRALDLGSGEGGDVLWLAAHGWDATGIELSRTAAARGDALATARGLPNARFVAADLADWATDPEAVDGSAEGFDLVTASYLQSPVALERAEILRAAAGRVMPGGYLLVVSHAAAPAHATAHRHHMSFPTPDSELAALELDERQWEIVTAEVRERRGTAPDGTPSTFEDTVILARRDPEEADRP